MSTAATAPERLGRYRIVAELGRGAMGIVYKGEDSILERVVAIKTVLMTFGSEDHAGYLARFRQEAKALGGLNHPAIITVYDFGDERDIAYMAMEYLEGRELRDLLAEARLPLVSAVEIAAQVAEGLAFAHSRGIVHRDIKPGNIMVLDGNRAKIMDFGIARVRTSDVKTQAGTLLGSPKYMSPEQVVGKGVDQRSDIFSLGVVLYEMLAGAAPFSGEDVPQIMFNVCNARAIPPSRLNPAVHEVLDLVVAKAMEKKPEDRYQNAAALAADLRAFLSGAQPLRAPQPADAGMPVVEATIPDKTAPQTAANPSDALGLSAWRRFDSARAIERLARPRGEDRALMAATIARPSLATRLAHDRVFVYKLVATAVALAIAAALVLA